MVESVAIATLNGKAYSNIVTLLRAVNIGFLSITPGERAEQHVDMIITTRSERSLVKYRNVICVEDLGEDPLVAKERLYHRLHMQNKDTLIVGVDPGERIGIAVYYQQREVGGETLNSLDGAIARIIFLLEQMDARKKLVRVGVGAPERAMKIAEQLSKHFDVKLAIEFVDEQGTSRLKKRVDTKLTRDQRSAMLIALRQGRPYSLKK